MFCLPDWLPPAPLGSHLSPAILSLWVGKSADGGLAVRPPGDGSQKAEVCRSWQSPSQGGPGNCALLLLNPLHPDPFLGLPGTRSVLGVRSLPDIQVLPELLSHPGPSFCYLNWYDLLL